MGPCIWVARAGTHLAVTHLSLILLHPLQKAPSLTTVGGLRPLPRTDPAKRGGLYCLARRHLLVLHLQLVAKAEPFSSKPRFVR